MRVIHFERISATDHVEPRCGSWGPTDTGWTDVPDGVTCVACRNAMRDGVPEGVRVEAVSARA